MHGETEAQERTCVKFSMDETSYTLLNGDIHKKESVVLSSWIHKSSSLPFLSAFDAEGTQFRPSLRLRDFNGHHEFKSQGSEPNAAVCDVKHSNRLTFSEKKSLIRKRLIPLIISLLILGAAVAVHLFVPVLSSHETGSVGNDILIKGFNVTSNTTRNR